VEIRSFLGFINSLIDEVLEEQAGGLEEEEAEEAEEEEVGEEEEEECEEEKGGGFQEQEIQGDESQSTEEKRPKKRTRAKVSNVVLQLLPSVMTDLISDSPDCQDCFLIGLFPVFGQQNSKTLI
jgi:hypothetical protein